MSLTAQQQQQQVTQFLSGFSSQYPVINDSVQELSELYNKKLWHNITEKLQELVKRHEFANVEGGKVLHQLYENVIVHFEAKLNFLKLAEIVVGITRKQTDAKEAIQFLESVSKRLEDKKGSNEALAILKTEIATWLLRTKDYEGCRDILRAVKDIIEKTGHVDNTVHAAFYKTYAEYWKLTDDPNEFYKNALLYLAYTPIEHLQLIEQQATAFDLGIAALLGDAIYNFGELLGHPVVESLSGSQAEWLYKLLVAFNRGNIAEYQQILKSTERLPQILKDKEKFLLEKVQLMSLMELVFNRPADNRIISFVDVSHATGVSAERVEPLLLKALAYNLIRGVIDEVQQSIQVKWAQPRVLDKIQIASLQNKIGGWLDKVDRTLNYLQEQGSVGDLVVS